jgi:ATP-dependent Lon protease
MTGEITLSGRVLPIGGVKEKVLGACRAGITNLILPAENAADLDDIREEERRSLTFHAVKDLNEVLRIALRPLPAPSIGAMEPEEEHGFVPSRN